MRRREFITLVSNVAIGWPVSVLGAHGKPPRIGVLLLGYPNPETFLTGLRKGLSDLGYEEGRSVELVTRSAEGQQAALLSLAGELMRLDVDIIVAFPAAAGVAAKQITVETPIVVYGGDLEATHLVAGLARPGGNVTGISGATADLAAKNLELLTEMLPTVRRVAVLANADSPLRKALLDHVQMKITRSMFGKSAFKRYYRGTEKNPAGYWEPKKFNASLFDVVMYTFAREDKNIIFQNKDAIREALIVLMTENEEFIGVIELSTSSVQAVTKRFDLWRSALQGIIGIGKKEPRCFTLQLKEALFTRDPTCAICSQRIVAVDDAAVDHIEQYWTGGKTIPENARLTHRYCNWSRPRKN